MLFGILTLFAFLLYLFWSGPSVNSSDTSDFDDLALFNDQEGIVESDLDDEIRRKYEEIDEQTTTSFMESNQHAVDLSDDNHVNFMD